MRFMSLVFIVLMAFSCASKQKVIPTVELSTSINERREVVPARADILETETNERKIEIVCPKRDEMDFQLKRIIESKNINGLMELVVVFQNLDTDKENSGEYKIQFFSSLGEPVGPVIGWDPLFLKPGESKHVKVSSTNEKVSYYKIHFHGEKNSKGFSQ